MTILVAVLLAAGSGERIARLAEDASVIRRVLSAVKCGAEAWAAAERRQHRDRLAYNRRWGGARKDQEIADLQAILEATQTMIGNAGRGLRQESLAALPCSGRSVKALSECVLLEVDMGWGRRIQRQPREDCSSKETRDDLAVLRVLEGDDPEEPSDPEPLFDPGPDRIATLTTKELNRLASESKSNLPRAMAGPSQDERNAAAADLNAAGNKAYATGDLDGAIAQFLEALKQKPKGESLKNAYRGLGTSYSKQHDKPSTVRYMKLYLPMAPEDEKAAVRRIIDYYSK